MQGNRKRQCTRDITLVLGLVGLALGMFLTGCAGQQQYRAAKPLFMENIDKPATMEIAEEVLAKMHFSVEKADAERGLIRTAPLTGAQFFEFWRSDNVGFDNWLEANLNSIRRVAQLNIQQQGQWISVDCKVQVYRLSLPERDFGSSAHVYQMFSISSTALQRLSLDHEQRAKMTWINLDQDEQLAAEILRQIEEQIDYRQTVSSDI